MVQEAFFPPDFRWSWKSPRIITEVVWENDAIVGYWVAPESYYPADPLPPREECEYRPRARAS